ncbi:MAG TPA: ribonuclease J [Candidatus Faecalibacterium avium]|uniref:ribonuclease J n=1 Tax=Faecalibacterium sp. An58 TaxID=1965648 RepID=UPI000B36BD70|nr:ribonuclease J [Faecalibacterium sp. An58]OUN75659.1 RNase J family beta-CASP ribonuclease [Faecalibacterium sp. An58]HIV44003.1 ribonuclease J [Candidatus Faecalibacterium avium]
MATKENTGTSSGSARRPSPAADNRVQRTRRPMRRPRRPQPPKGGAAVPIHIYPLGGLGEVGKNMTVYECCGDMIIVDCGLVFPDSEMYGVDMVIPDFTFVLQNKDKIKGLLITHGHEDHIGSIPYLLQKMDLPVYGTRLTLGLIRNKLEEFNLAGKTRFVEIVPRQKLQLGCFTVEPIHVNHSIPDAVAFAIESPAGVVIQTGDFKIDYTPLACGPTDLTTLAEYGRKGVLALLSDSTNAERPGFTATEQKVAAGVHNLFTQARNKRIIIATFASNIYRIQQIIDLAVQEGRKVAFSGRSMVNNTAMAQELGYMHIPDGTLISVDELNRYAPEEVVLITTGSQGEPLSALSRMASCSHRQVRVGPGDFIIISANPIPGNEKSVTKIVNGLLLLGAEVIYESMYDVHVSGHACQEEQKLMLTLTRPKFFLPVHGEYKQLKKHALTAASLGIPHNNILIAENGSNVILTQDEIKLGEPVTAGAVMVDGLGVGDVGNVVLRDRKHLSEDGLVIIVATVDGKTGRVLAGPDLVSRGFVYVRENESLMEGAQSTVEMALNRCVEERVRDWNSVKTRMREALSSYIYRRTKRSPMILPVLMEV